MILWTTVACFVAAIYSGRFPFVLIASLAVALTGGIALFGVVFLRPVIIGIETVARRAFAKWLSIASRTRRLAALIMACEIGAMIGLAVLNTDGDWIPLTFAAILATTSVACFALPPILARCAVISSSPLVLLGVFVVASERDLTLDSARLNKAKAIRDAVADFESSGRQELLPATVGQVGPAHSWRVAILPQLGRQDLFAHYHFDEAWNGPHNWLLHDHAPTEFAAWRSKSKTNWATLDCRSRAKDVQTETARFSANNLDIVIVEMPEIEMDWLEPMSISVAKYVDLSVTPIIESAEMPDDRFIVFRHHVIRLPRLLPHKTAEAIRSMTNGSDIIEILSALSLPIAPSSPWPTIWPMLSLSAVLLSGELAAKLIILSRHR